MSFYWEDHDKRYTLDLGPLVHAECVYTLVYTQSMEHNIYKWIAYVNNVEVARRDTLDDAKQRAETYIQQGIDRLNTLS